MRILLAGLVVSAVLSLFAPVAIQAAGDILPGGNGSAYMLAGDILPGGNGSAFMLAGDILPGGNG